MDTFLNQTSPAPSTCYDYVNVSSSTLPPRPPSHPNAPTASESGSTAGIRRIGTRPNSTSECTPSRTQRPIIRRESRRPSRQPDYLQLLRGRTASCYPSLHVDDDRNIVTLNPINRSATFNKYTGEPHHFQVPLLGLSNEEFAPPPTSMTFRHDQVQQQAPRDREQPEVNQSPVGPVGPPPAPAPPPQDHQEYRNGNAHPHEEVLRDGDVAGVVHLGAPVAPAGQ